MHDRLFETQGEWTGRSGAEKLFRRYAGDLGVDLDEYDACTREGRFRARIQASMEGGVILGVGSTPSYLIGDRLYGALTYDEMKSVVDSLAGAATQ
jgi:protein-disulfide isomerase